MNNLNNNDNININNPNNDNVNDISNNRDNDNDNDNDKHYNKNINIIMSQTNYNYEESVLKLKKYDNNIEKIIREYMGIEVVEKKHLTTNQEIYKQIRSYMDEASREYEKKKYSEITK